MSQQYTGNSPSRRAFIFHQAQLNSANVTRKRVAEANLSQRRCWITCIDVAKIHVSDFNPTAEAAAPDYLPYENVACLALHALAIVFNEVRTVLELPVAVNTPSCHVKSLKIAVNGFKGTSTVKRFTESLDRSSRQRRHGKEEWEQTEVSHRTALSLFLEFAQQASRHA
jgi:hypothetical protein